MDLLARREHSPAELRRKLAGRDFSPGEIETTLEALTREGLLSESRFLAGFVGSQARRGHGPIWIRAELEKRGVAGDEVAAALAAAGQDWVVLAREVRAKRFGPAAPADFRERARQMRFLQYRGFTADQVRQAVGDIEDDRALTTD